MTYKMCFEINLFAIGKWNCHSLSGRSYWPPPYRHLRLDDHDLHQAHRKVHRGATIQFVRSPQGRQRSAARCRGRRVPISEQSGNGNLESDWRNGHHSDRRSSFRCWRRRIGGRLHGANQRRKRGSALRGSRPNVFGRNLEIFVGGK